MSRGAGTGAGATPATGATSATAGKLVSDRTVAVAGPGIAPARAADQHVAGFSFGYSCQFSKFLFYVTKYI